MAANDQYAYLGVGEKYPTEITATGGIALQSGPDLIKQSIRRILETQLGTVFFNRVSGSRMREAQYEQDDDMLQSMLDQFINETIQDQEPRVEYLNTDYSFKNPNQPGLVLCTIYYRILQSNERDSMVWPYYTNN